MRESQKASNDGLTSCGRSRFGQPFQRIARASQSGGRNGGLRREKRKKSPCVIGEMASRFGLGSRHRRCRINPAQIGFRCCTAGDYRRRARARSIAYRAGFFCLSILTVASSFVLPFISLLFQRISWCIVSFGRAVYMRQLSRSLCSFCRIHWWYELRRAQLVPCL